MPKESKTSAQLAKLVQAESVRCGIGCDVMISPDPRHGWIATALVRGGSHAPEIQLALDAIVSDLRQQYELKRA